MRVFKIGQTWSNGKTSRLIRDVRGFGITYCVPSQWAELGDEAPRRDVAVWTFRNWVIGTRATLIAGPAATPETERLSS